MAQALARGPDVSATLTPADQQVRAWARELRARAPGLPPVRVGRLDCSPGLAGLWVGGLQLHLLDEEAVLSWAPTEEGTAWRRVSDPVGELLTALRGGA